MLGLLCLNAPASSAQITELCPRHEVGTKLTDVQIELGVWGETFSNNKEEN